MLTCIPKSIFSEGYRIVGAANGEADLKYNWLTEQGTIQWADRELAVVKHGWMSGRWTLEEDGKVLVEAFKPSPFFRSFEIQSGDEHFTLNAQSAFTRCFELQQDGSRIGTIEPEGLLTRRTKIDCHDDVPEFSQMFCFWLVGLMWRRQRKNQ